MIITVLIILYYYCPILRYDQRLNILCLMRLDKRRNRSDLIETFKICSLYLMMVAGEDTPESYLKDGVDWILKIRF